MLDIALNANINSTLTLGSAFLTIIVSFALGILISVTYMKTHVKGYYSQNFTLTLILIPAVIAVIILLVEVTSPELSVLPVLFPLPVLEVLPETLKISHMCFFQWPPDLPVVRDVWLCCTFYHVALRVYGCSV